MQLGRSIQVQCEVWLAGVLFAAVAGAASAQAPSVVEVSPKPRSIRANASAPIVIVFDGALDPASVTAPVLRVAGRWSGPASGRLSLDNGNTALRFDSDMPFFAGEWVIVKLSTGVRGVNGDALARGYSFSYWVAASPGALGQQLVTTVPIRENGEGHIQSYGAYAGDLDNDGWSDLTVPNEQSNDVRVFLNDQWGRYGAFARFAVPAAQAPSANEGGDFNGDGEIDLALGSTGNSQLSVLLGNGRGEFTQGGTYTAALGVRGVGVLDLNGDGHDDVVTANRWGDNLSLFVNDGFGGFSAAVNIDGGSANETALAVADANNDGIMDVFVGSYQGRELVVLLGDGRGGFTFSSKVGAGGQSWMIAAGDVNGDGNEDVVSANSFDNNASVAFGDGAGGLLPAVTYPTDAFPLAIDLGDIDGDGDLDLVTSNFQGASWTVYENDGTGGFVAPRRLAADAAGSCAILHDRDNDGDIDITGVDELVDKLFIFVGEPSPDGEVPGARVFNHPNPFNEVTTISYEIPADGYVRLSVFDAGGRIVDVIVSEPKSAGRHDVVWQPPQIASGVYFARLASGGNVATHKLIQVR